MSLYLYFENLVTQLTRSRISNIHYLYAILSIEYFDKTFLLLL